jgi:hypothetical protein
MRSLARHCRLIAYLIIAAVGFFGTISGTIVRPALAQDDVVADFREVLAPYGQWSQHPRWGEVWIPTKRLANWAPYRYGHWAYTEEWGWYWVSDEDFGWITYHYGRWILDPDLSWVWIPGPDWSPAWVSWRRGEEAVGWAPIPPDEVIDEYDDQPEVWCFVRPEEIFTLRVAFVAFPRAQDNEFVQRTVLVSRTILAQQGGRRVAANPGIPPSFIASMLGRPIQTAAIRPHVIRGTVGVTGAVVGGVGVAIHETVEPQTMLIQPAALVPPPIRFQPSHANLGPDTPNALRHLQTLPSGPGASTSALGAPAIRGLHGGPGQQEEFHTTPLPPLPPPQLARRPPPEAPKPPQAVQTPRPRSPIGRDQMTSGF